jgi:hypothetical protein
VHYTKAIVLFPKEPTVFEQRARIWEEINNYTKASADFRASLKLRIERAERALENAGKMTSR